MPAITTPITCSVLLTSNVVAKGGLACIRMLLVDKSRIGVLPSMQSLSVLAVVREPEVPALVSFETADGVAVVGHPA